MGFPFPGASAPAAPISIDPRTLSGIPAYDSLSSLSPEEISDLLDSDSDELTDPDEEDLSTREGQSPTGSEVTEPDDIVALSDDQRSLLEYIIYDFISDYSSAMDDRHKIEDEIRDAYMLIGSPEQGGPSPGGSQLVSGLLRRLVVQVAARLNRNLDSVKPGIVVDPIEGAGLFGSKATADMAKSTQNFLLNYSQREIKLDHIRPITILRAAKVGTAVLHVDWEETTTRALHYNDDAKLVRTTETLGGVKARLIDNRNVILWPPTIQDWADAEWMGHYVFLTRSQWAVRAASLGLDAETISMVEAHVSPADKSASEEANRHAIRTSAVDDHRDRSPIEIVELWGNTILPGESQPAKFQLFFHPGLRKILGPVTYNRLFSQDHPYCPIRYDWNDNAAWGTGVGHELLNYWSADCAMRNLSMDLLRSTFPVILRDAGSMWNVEAQAPRPGMQIPVNDTTTDFVTRNLGGPAPGLEEAIASNLNEARETSSFAPVLSGLGDPTQKSGAGTGSTLALIEQGGQRLAQVDTYLRNDWGRFYNKVLELVAQFAPNGVLYRYADPQDATIVKNLKYVPPRGRISDMFRIRVMAPSAGTSSESRKQNYLMVWGFATQAVGLLQQMMGPLLQKTNPAGFDRWMQEVGVFIQTIMQKVVEYNELPGVGELVPKFPEATPEDQQINQLNQELQSAQAQLAQLQQMAQQMTGGQGQGPEGGPPGGMMGEGQDPMMMGMMGQGMGMGMGQGPPGSEAPEGQMPMGMPMGAPPDPGMSPVDMSGMGVPGGGM